MTDSQLELINIPDVVMNEILEYLDFPEILKLRKVCHYFKDFIDEVKSKSILKDINIIFYPKEIRFDLFSVQNERYVILYEKFQANGCRVSQNGREKILENSDFREIFIRDLEILLKLQKSIFRVFRLIRRDQNDFDYFLENFPKTPELKIQEFYMDAGDDAQNEISKILGFLNSKFLISLSFHPYGGRKVLNLSEISKMDHWKNAEQLYVNRNIFVILDVLKLEHFSLVEVKMDRLRGKELLELREMKSSEDVLRITHNSEVYSVNFKRIRKENVPEGFSIY
ncbi:Protein CBG18615 [Caenorhabditis briggsae]|uniref:Protein CBG18615 n=1 Tax=Caenorhabditis briggsae TaxID=6238 RepID=A8XTQ2_CAEBR|nr:Protein CBG18615 [Caenorhabditis briggsae]CAP36028.2 Protein CBG18615 [Caenorhabditis briggsae]